MDLINDSHITGTMIHYESICKRKLWLHLNRIDYENYDEKVLIGKALHEKNMTEEIELENIKMDGIEGEYIIEYKKTDLKLKSSKMQLLFYIYELEKRGVFLKGKLIFEENIEQSEKEIIVEMNDFYRKEIEKSIKNIEKIKLLESPPRFKKIKNCKNCAFRDFCFA